jgi:ParB family chromosome partitioning protein
VTLTAATQVLNLALDELIPDPSQPRKTFLEDEIARLAASIRARGVLQPLRVMRDEQRNGWVILTGESRSLAARLAGLQTVPCLLVSGQLSEVEKLADRLTENDVRHDLQPMEAARALARLKALKGCTAKALVEEYGFSGAAISKAEALLSLPPDIQERVGSGVGQIAPATAYELSRLPDEQSQRDLAEVIVSKRLSRDAAAEAVRGRIGKRNVTPKAGRLNFKLGGGIAVTVSSGEPLTFDALLTALDYLRRQAKKLSDEGKGVDALSRVVRAS